MTYTPDIEAQTANLLHARTRDANGKELREWMPLADGRTNPTLEEVQGLIVDANNELYPVFGDNIPDTPGDPTRVGYDADALRKAVDRVKALRVAALIELSYYSNEVSRGNSPYPLLNDSFEAALKRAQRAIQEAGAGDLPGAIDDSFEPAYEFPNDSFAGGAFW